MNYEAIGRKIINYKYQIVAFHAAQRAIRACEVDAAPRLALLPLRLQLCRGRGAIYINNKINMQREEAKYKN